MLNLCLANVKHLVYYFWMDKDLVKIDSLIIKQAVRDIASKDQDRSLEALTYFKSKDFVVLCERNKIDSDKIKDSVDNIVQYPIISRKKISNEIAKLIDKSFVEGVLSK
jgi:hypothetical protein